MPRRRRTPDEARGEILGAAESLLAEGGPAAVQVRAVAACLAITDAAVNYHFGTRDQLLLALLHHGGRKLHAEVEEVSQALARGDCDLGEIVERLSQLYRNGYAELLVGLRQAGWRDRGKGLMSELVEAVHQRRPAPRPPIADTQLAIAALNQALLADALLGRSSRRAAGHTSPSGAREQRAWWVAALTTLLGLDDHAPARSGQIRS